MEAKKKLSYSSRSNVNYALIYNINGRHVVETSDKSPWHRYHGSSEIALKDVEYSVIDGILYIKGTQIYYYRIDDIFNILTTWGSRTLATINQNNNKDLILPFVEEDIYIRRWWWKNKKIKGLEIGNYSLNNWYPSKRENPCEVTLSDFKLIEHE